MKAHYASVVGIQLQPPSWRIGVVKEANGLGRYLDRHWGSPLRWDAALDLLGCNWSDMRHNNLSFALSWGESEKLQTRVDARRHISPQTRTKARKKQGAEIEALSAPQPAA
jgi:hypothetical protein